MALFVACSVGDYDPQTFRGENKEIKIPKAIKLEAEKVDFDGLIGQVDMYVKDTFAFFYIYSDKNSFLHIYSTRSKKLLAKVGRKGDGPDDYFNFGMRGYFKVDSLGGIHMWARDNENKIRLIDISKSISDGKIAIEKTFKAKCDIGSTYCVNDTLARGFSFSPDSNIGFFEVNPSLGDDRGKYIYNTYTDPVVFNKEYQLIDGMKTFNSDGTKYAFTPVYFNTILVYDWDKKELKSASVGKALNRNNVNVSNRITVREFYTYMRVTDAQIWGMYSGAMRINVGKGAPAIHVYDWDLNPLYHFEIDEKIKSICIDEVGKCLYGFDDEDQMYRYDVSKYIR